MVGVSPASLSGATVSSLSEAQVALSEAQVPKLGLRGRLPSGSRRRGSDDAHSGAASSLSQSNLMKLGLRGRCFRRQVGSRPYT